MAEKKAVTNKTFKKHVDLVLSEEDFARTTSGYSEICSIRFGFLDGQQAVVVIDGNGEQHFLCWANEVDVPQIIEFFQDILKAS